MESVIDASALLAVVLEKDIRPLLLELTLGVTLIAPTSLPWEVGNALSSLVKRQHLTLD